MSMNRKIKDTNEDNKVLQDNKLLGRFELVESNISQHLDKESLARQYRINKFVGGIAGVLVLLGIVLGLIRIITLGN